MLNFRNYEYGAGRDSHFRGGTKHNLWQAIQASAAAPGYFEEVSFLKFYFINTLQSSLITFKKQICQLSFFVIAFACELAARC